MIAEKKEEKQKVLDQMEIQKEIFLDELSKFTIEWFEKETLSTIKSNSEKVIELGEDQARELKSKIEELKKGTPELVKQYLEEGHLWWHSNEDKFSYYSGSRRLLEAHDKKIRLMLGELGIILIEYGLAKAKSEFGSNFSTSSWTQSGSSKVKFSYGMDYSDKLYSINNQYIELIRKAQEINDQIKKVEEKKNRENVEGWWKSL